jgi:hypothetical protein
MSRSSEPVAVNRAAVNGSTTKSLSWYFPLSRGSGPRGTRTHNPRIKSPLRCQLRQRPKQ